MKLKELRRGNSLAIAGAFKNANEAGSVGIERTWKLEPTTSRANCSCLGNCSLSR